MVYFILISCYVHHSGLQAYVVIMKTFAEYVLYNKEFKRELIKNWNNKQEHYSINFNIDDVEILLILDMSLRQLMWNYLYFFK